MDSEQDLPTARITLAVDPAYNDLTPDEQFRYQLYLAAVLTDHAVADWREAERKTAAWREVIRARQQAEVDRWAAVHLSMRPDTDP